MDLYPWVVVAHVFFVIVAFGAHGVSAFAMYRVKSEPDRGRLVALLELSQSALLVAGVALLVAIGLGILAAIMGNWFSRWWTWASILVLVVVIGMMTPFAANPMDRVRGALGLRNRHEKEYAPKSDEDLRNAKAALRPGLVMGTGVVALALLVWLMEIKPF
jgi:uncharacterized membrane protein SirB2